MSTDSNPYAAPVGGKLSAEDQAEYDRLEALELDQSGDGGVPEDETTTQVGETKSPEDPRDAADPEVAARYPVENGAVRWDDAANGGDTSRGGVHTYDTPWGKRPMSEHEVADLKAQGVECTRVDDEPETSLAREKSDMSHVEFGTAPDKA